MKFLSAVLVVLLTAWETDAFVGSSLVPRATQQRRAGTTAINMVRVLPFGVVYRPATAYIIAYRHTSYGLSVVCVWMLSHA